MFKRVRRSDEEDPKGSQSAPVEAPRAAATTGSAPQPDAGERRMLGELLIEAGAVNREELDAALAKQKETKGFLGQILVEMGALEQSTLTTFLVKQCRIPHLNLLDYNVDPDIAKLLPRELCVEHSVIAVDKLGNTLTIAMVDPLDTATLERVRAQCPDLRIKPILCEWEHFQQVATRILGKEDGEQGEMEVARFGLPEEEEAPPSPPPEPEPEQTPPLDQAAPPNAAPATQTPPVASAAPRPAGAVGAVPEDLTQAVSQSVRDAMHDAAAVMATQIREAAQGGVASAAPEDLSSIMRDSVRDAMREALSEFRPEPQQAPAFTLKELVGGMRESLHDAMKDALTTVVRESPAGAGPSTHDMAVMMQESLRDALREAMGDLTKSIQSVGTASLPSQDAQPVIEEFRKSQQAQEERIAKLTEATLQAAEAAQQAMQTATSTHGDQAAQILAAARAAEEAAARAEEQAQRTAENMETLSVEEQRKRGLKGPGHVHRKKRKADAILGKAESDALESMEENGVELRIDERILAALESEAPLGGFTLDNFFTGKANQFATKLARAVAEHPGSAYNPFFLHGGVGLGKTHLINGIGNLLIERDPDLHVGYVSSSRFSRKLADALEAHSLDEFREAYARWDVLIFDDIQFLGGRIEAQEEFFHLFNALYQEDRQIVIAGDRPPDQLGQLEDRLISRFGSGIVAALQPPEWETRLQILHHQVERASASVPEEILALIATKVSHDVRKMTGALRKVLAYAELMGTDVSADLVSQILGHVGAEAPA